MTYRIAVASGKGGTGKTTVTANLFHYFKQSGKQKVMLADCDVEEPNAAIFFNEFQRKKERPVNQEIPVIDGARCTFCRKCTEYCEFNAIVVIPPAGFAEINPSMCHSCGACSVACEIEAIRVRDEPVGTLTQYSTNGAALLEGRLRVGSPMQTMVIRELKRDIGTRYELILLDAPPGTSCPVVETISGSDYLVLVTEPTPFGVYDLSLMVDLVREMKIPFGVIINKAGIGENKVYDYLEKEDIDLLGEVPFSQAYACGYAEGKLFSQVPDEIRSAYLGICDHIAQKTGTG
ncbi:MAG: nucleotide-binding protein [Bacteroidales bacterium]